MLASHFSSLFTMTACFLHCVHGSHIMLKMALSGGDATASSGETPMRVYVDTSGAVGSTLGSGDVITVDSASVAAGWTQNGSTCRAACHFPWTLHLVRKLAQSRSPHAQCPQLKETSP